MIAYPHIDPVLFQIGPLQVRWYGLMYVLGFIASFVLVRRQVAEPGKESLAAHYENLNTALIVGLILGGRLGYVLFYNLSYYLAHPAEIVATWQGGMSFHGALIGTLAAGIIYCRQQHLDFWMAADTYVVTVPIGLGLGRFGNFINGELYGRVTDVPWAMVFPDGGDAPRHPSQLYECGLEGMALFAILWGLRRRVRPSGRLLALFLSCYALFRFFVEQFREPDPQIGFLYGRITMGQLLSLLMLAAGLAIWRLRGNGGAKGSPGNA